MSTQLIASCSKEFEHNTSNYIILKNVLLFLFRISKGWSLKNPNLTTHKGFHDFTRRANRCLIYRNGRRYRV